MKRLSGWDAVLLYSETPTVHMHTLKLAVIDLSELGEVAGLQFCMSSSDVGQWGMNTPGYFVMDTMIPEPASLILLGLGALIAAKTRRVKN